MNLNEFVAAVNEISNANDNLKLFRTWANNEYISYRKLYKRELEETKRGIDEGKFSQSEEFENLRNDWVSYSYYDIVSLYSEMGWELDDDLMNRQLSYFSDPGCFEYDASFFEIYEKIMNIEDNIEYCYALLIAIEKINDHTSLFKYYASKIYIGLAKFGLSNLKSLISSIKQPSAFVAMSFNENMDEARNTITKAIDACGYKAMLIDTKEHNGQIVPEIYKEIESCRFILADLSGQRGGVYFEAGYAKALNKEIILTCRDCEKTEVHFDVAQINTIFWKNEDDLYSRLVRRIETTIGKNNIY